MKTLKLSCDYTNQVIENEIDGAGLKTIAKRKKWANYGFEKCMDIDKIEDGILDIENAEFV